MGIYPAVDPLASTSRALAPEIVGQEHYNVARGVQKVLQRLKDCRISLQFSAWNELAPEDKLTVLRARNSTLPEPAIQRGASISGREGKPSLVAETVRASRRSSQGSTTPWRKATST